MALPSASVTASDAPSVTRPAALTWTAIFAYSLPGIGASFLFTLITVMYLNFGTDVLLAPSAWLGFILLSCKAWAAVADTMAGFLSDRTRSRFGRRKPWVVTSAPIIALTTLAVWSPPRGLSGWALIAWLAVSIFGFYTAFTFYEVPHLALGAQLSYDPSARGRLYGTRQLLRGLGLFMAFGLGARILQDLSTARHTAHWLALAVGSFTAVSLVLGMWVLPAEIQSEARSQPQNPLRAVRDVWGNRNARIVLIVYFIEMLGIGGTGTVTPYLLRYVLNMPDRMAVMLACYAVPTIASIPLWVWLGNRYEKRNIWLFAMVMAVVGFGMMLFVAEGRWVLMAVAMLLAGTAMGCGQCLGIAVQAEIVDADELATGQRKDGSYFAAWAFVGKLGGAIMVWVVGVALAWSGYVPKQAQTELVKNTLRFLMGGIPALGFGIGALIFRSFSLTRAEHAQIRASLDDRAARSETRAE